MIEDSKVCKYCHKVNDIKAGKCQFCGRFFTELTKGVQSSSFGDNLKKPVVILAVALFVSLFLPWFSIFIIKLSAFNIARLFDQAGQFAEMKTSVFSVIKVLIYLTPVGCAAVVISALMDRGIRLAGLLTGGLPLAVFFLMLSQGTGFIEMIGIGFIMAILSGVALIYFSLKEE